MQGSSFKVHRIIGWWGFNEDAMLTWHGLALAVHFGMQSERGIVLRVHAAAVARVQYSPTYEFIILACPSPPSFCPCQQCGTPSRRIHCLCDHVNYVYIAARTPAHHRVALLNRGQQQTQNCCIRPRPSDTTLPHTQPPPAYTHPKHTDPPSSTLPQLE